MIAGSEQAKAPLQAERDNGPSPIDQLMRDLGATRWDPTPVDQHDFFLDEIPGESPLQRALAWMRAHTIRRGRSKAYAVDENGKELHIERMAADLNWKVKWAQEVWRVGERHGLFRREKEFPSRMYLNGKVTRVSSRIESFEHRKRNRCTADCSPFVLPAYLVRQMANWRPQRRTEVEALLERQHHWKEMVMRDGVAALRAITEQRDDRLLRYLGLEKQQHPKRREPPETVRVDLLVEPDFFSAAEATSGSGPAVVQPAPSLVPPPQTPDVEWLASAVVQSGLYEGNWTSGHQSGATVHCPQQGAQVMAGEADKAAEGVPPLKPLETTRGDEDPPSSSSALVAETSEATTTTGTRSAAETETTQSPPPEHTPSQQVEQALSLDSEAARRLLEGCWKEDPLITPREIVLLAETKLQQVRGLIRQGKIGDIPGFLITSVPKAVNGELRQAIRKEAAAAYATEPGPEAGIDQYVAHWANQLRGKPGFEEVAQGLERLCGDTPDLADDLEATEKALSDLDARMLSIARNSSERKGIESQIAVEPDNRHYKQCMTGNQFRMLTDQQLDRRLCEALGLPRLSLFYISGLR